MIVHIVALEISPNARSAAALVRVERVNVGARLSRQETGRPVYSKSYTGTLREGFSRA